MTSRSLPLALSTLLILGCIPDPDPEVDPPTPEGRVDGEALLERLAELADDAQVPGLAACVMADAAVEWCGALGFADVERGVEVTPDTAFLLASVSKTVSATAVLQRRDAGDFGLDDDVDGLVDFTVQHPAGGSITPRRLLTHSAGFRDNWNAMGDWYVDGADPDRTLEEVLRGYFDPAGAWYDADDNFTSWLPGDDFEYANMGASLAGYVAEVAGQESLADLTEQSIFEPLRMDHTSWWLADFEPDDLAMPHEWTGGAFVPYGQYSFADYPSGALRSSARDMARFGAAYLGGGQLDGARILAESTVTEMLSVHADDGRDGTGLGWFHVGEGWVGHTGGEMGAATALFLHPGDRVGYVVLMNGDGDGGTLGIEEELAAVASSLAD